MSKNPLRVRAYQPTNGSRYSYPHIEITDHQGCLGTTCGHNVKSTIGPEVILVTIIITIIIIIITIIIITIIIITIIIIIQ